MAQRWKSTLPELPLWKIGVQTILIAFKSAFYEAHKHTHTQTLQTSESLILMAISLSLALTGPGASFLENIKLKE